jgi:hypothetical protein
MSQSSSPYRIESLKIRIPCKILNKITERGFARAYFGLHSLGFSGIIFLN